MVYMKTTFRSHRIVFLGSGWKWWDSSCAGLSNLNWGELPMKWMAGAVLLPKVRVDETDAGSTLGEANLSLDPSLAHDMLEAYF